MLNLGNSENCPRTVGVCVCVSSESIFSSNINNDYFYYCSLHARQSRLSPKNRLCKRAIFCLFPFCKTFSIFPFSVIFILLLFIVIVDGQTAHCRHFACPATRQLFSNSGASMRPRCSATCASMHSYIWIRARSSLCRLNAPCRSRLRRSSVLRLAAGPRSTGRRSMAHASLPPVKTHACL